MTATKTARKFNRQNKTTLFWSEIKEWMFNEKLTWEEIRQEYIWSLEAAEERLVELRKEYSRLLAGRAQNLATFDRDEKEVVLSIRLKMETIAEAKEFLQLENPFHS